VIDKNVDVKDMISSNGVCIGVDLEEMFICMEGVSRGV